MKKRFFARMAVVMVGFSPLCVFAQMPQVPQMPLDPAVRYGKLDNGLTYYIRHNELPEDRAEFYIAQRVGSVLEEDSQRGLAHFLEHMAFNGTKNFPGKSMLNYLETNGVKFGTNVNAYTSIDETVYNLSNVPTMNGGLVDSCLLILHDWSGFITLDGAEIDNERSVIHEEWRTRANPYLRMYENVIMPALYPNNRYGERMPIGTMEVVDNFAHDELRNYYHKWYRPDLQAIIIVGDIDVDKVEARIKEMWKDIPKAENAAERVYFSVEDNKEPLIGIASDKEASMNVLSVMYKQDVLPDSLMNSQVGMFVNIINGMISGMLNDRYEEISQKADAPFMSASGEYGKFFLAKTKDAFAIDMTFKDGEWQNGLSTLLAVANSAREFGFTPSEYERAKAELLSKVENAYNEREKVKNEQYVQEYLDHFLNAQPTPGIETEYMIATQVVPNIPLEQVNMAMKQYITPENIAIMMFGVEKEGVAYPSKEELLAAYTTAAAVPAVAYEETTSNEPLIAQVPKAGKVKSEKPGDFGTTVWTLSNGAKVIYKQTDFKKDQIMLSISSPGGSSLLSDNDISNIKVLDDVITLGGVGAFSKTDLTKALAGKRVEVSPYIASISEGITASSTPKDLETLMQLVYLHFTAPRQDADAYQAWYNRTMNTLANLEANPMVTFSDSLSATLYNHNPRMTRIRPADLEKVDYNRIFDIYKERFANAGDFSFTFVGNVDPTVLKPLVEQYIASLPATKGKETFKKIQPRVVEGSVNNRFTQKMATPKVTVYNVLSGNCDYTMQNNLKMTMLKQIMDIVYVETIREEEGGTYGVGTRATLDINPENQFVFLYGFDTGEEMSARLEARAYDELKKIAKEGPKQENFNKVKEYLGKKYNEDIKENDYWMGTISFNDRYNKDNHTGYLEALNAVTPDMIRDFAAMIVNSGNRVEVVCTGIAQD